MKPYITTVSNTTHYLHTTLMYNIIIYVFIYYITAVFTRGFYANDDNDDTRHTHTTAMQSSVHAHARFIYTLCKGTLHRLALCV